jgi:hypothetical protein
MVADGSSTGAQEMMNNA